MSWPRRKAWPAIAAFSLLFHLKGLFAPPTDYHYHRQTNTAAIARNFHRNGLDFLTPQIDWDGPNRARAATEFPLYMWLVGLLWPAGGLGAAWGRVLSTLFSAATAVYLYELLLRRLEPQEALAGAAVFCFLPVEIYFGRTVQPEALALLATMASLYHWDRALDGRRPWSHWAAAVAFAFLAIAHKLPYAYLLLVLAALAFLRLGAAAWRDGRVWLAPAACLAGVAAWYGYAKSGAYVVPTHGSEFALILDYANLPRYLWFELTSRFPELTTTYGGLLFFALGARELRRRGDGALFAWWLAAVCLYSAAGGAYIFHHEYTSLPFAPVNAALIGVGLVALARRARGAAALVAVAALSMPVHAVCRIDHWYRTSYAFLENAGAAAAQVSAPDDLFICNERAASLYLFFLDRRGWSWDLAELGPSSLSMVPDFIAKGARFFMTRKDASFLARGGPYASYFYERYPVVYDDGEILIFRLAAETAAAVKGSRASRP